MGQQLGDRELLHLVVLGDQQALLARLHVVGDARKGGVQALGAGRLVDVGEGAARQALLTILVHGQDLHRDVARLERALELAEHVPAQHVGQEDIERHGVGLVFLGKLQRLGAPHGDQRLHAGGVGGIDHDAGIVGVVLDDQQLLVVGVEVVTVVRHLDQALGQRDRRRRSVRLRGQAHRGARARVHGRQEEREGRADARGRAQRELAAEQGRELARDGEAEARAAVLAAGRGVGLLEGLEHDLLLLDRDADAGVGDLEGHDRARLVERRVVRPPAGEGRSDAQAHAALGGELHGVRQQVLQDLQQALGVRDDRAGEVGIDHRLERQALRFGLVAERPGHALERRW